MAQAIEEGAMVFVSDGHAGIDSISRMMPHGRPELVMYVENAGDFTVPLAAVADVHFGKVVLACERLSAPLRRAIGHTHHDEQSVVPAVAAAPAPNAGLGILFTERQRNRLEALRKQFAKRERSIAAERVTHGQQRASEAREMEEDGKDTADIDVEEGLHRVDERRVRQIDRALGKIAEGTYGISDVSGKVIPKSRLEAAPEATVTVEEEFGWESARH